MYARGVGLSTHSDSELITQSLCLDPPGGCGERPDWPARIRHLMALTPLAYSLLIMDNDRVYGVRDPYGNRPLCLGKVLREGADRDNVDAEADAWVISSESCSFQSIGARYVREVLPGEIVELSRDGIKTLATVGRPDGGPPAFCIFEFVYFSRPDTIYEGWCRPRLYPPVVTESPETYSHVERFPLCNCRANRVLGAQGERPPAVAGVAGRGRRRVIRPRIGHCCCTWLLHRGT